MDTFLCQLFIKFVKKESHVANIRTFNISGTYTLFSYLLSGGNWHNELGVLDISPLVLLLEM